jgi:uncharacterized protein (DUF2235 family)
MSGSGRRLLFLFDGTSNTAAGPKDVVPTNILRLNQALTYGFSGVPQIVFYFAGVGTRGDKLSAATGRGFDQIVIESFVNLASNFMAGDCIYLFGFSRGAAAARALAGMLSNPGLLSADNLVHFPELWRYFTGRHLGAAERHILMAKIENSTFKPTVEFLGAFDTVAGSSWDQFNLFTKVRFHNLHLDASVKCGVQILAIDDDRNPSFSPLVWDGAESSDQMLEQIWMPGVHADIGGCSDGTLIGDIALLTMIERVQHHCPELEWDTGVIERIRNRVTNSQSIEISYERPGIARKLLWRKKRVIGSGKAQYLHPIYKVLCNKKFRIKRKLDTYAPDNCNQILPEFPLVQAQLFCDACNALVLP